MAENYQICRDEEALHVNPPHDARIWVQCGNYAELSISHINLADILRLLKLDITELRDEMRMTVVLMR